MIDHRRKCIFVHIPKCGGTTVEKIFGAKLWQHENLSRIRQQVKEPIFGSYFKFAFVRNPWDRVVSTYHWGINHIVAFPEKGIRPLKNESFEEYLYRMKEAPSTLKRTGGYNAFFGSQLWWLTYRQKYALDYLGRMETFDLDLRYVCQRLGVEVPPVLPRLNSSKHEPYQTYYTPNTKKLIYDLFREDIDFFGFKFDSSPGPKITLL